LARCRRQLPRPRHGGRPTPRRASSRRASAPAGAMREGVGSAVVAA
jgi:hypothetical protein